MKKVLMWVGGILVALIVLGALFGEDEQKPNDRAAKIGTTTTEEVSDDTPESTPTPEPAPTPEPLDVSYAGPMQTTSDEVKLKGEVALKGAKVKVNGKPATVHGRHWSFVAAIGHKGDNRYTVVATKAGHPKDKTTAVVTRNLSAAETAVIRQEKAERRANGRALQSAESYLAMSGFSKQGLYEQLSSSAGEGFTQGQAQYAVDHVDADWNREAVQSARSYLELMPMSRAELIEQLSSSAGEGFTYEQALYAVNKVY
jgi:Host cell surface-exposed lipoprotein